MHRTVLMLMLALLLPVNTLAWDARIVEVIDGDTIMVEPVSGGERTRVRLHGIDAPERRQPGGEAARGFVFDVALYQRVDVESVGKPDRYGRTVAIIILPSGESLQSALLKAGLAWVWPRYCKRCDEWEALQEEARVAGRGIWQSEPIEPWKWRGGRK